MRLGAAQACLGAGLAFAADEPNSITAIDEMIVMATKGETPLMVTPLVNALGPPPPDFAGVAKRFGIIQERLMDAMGVPPGGPPRP